MKILLFPEIFIVRDTQAYHWIMSTFAALAAENALSLAKHYDPPVSFCVVTSRSLSPAIASYPWIAEILTSYKSIYPLTSKENEYIESLYSGWDHQNVELWEHLLRGDTEQFEQYYDILYRIYTENHIDAIITWGTNGIVKRFCQDHNLKHFTIEFGCTRYPFFESIFFDPIGVNGASIFTRADIDALIAATPKAPFLDDDYFGLSSSALFSAIPYDLKVTKKPKVLIPFQLEDDANILIFSPFKNVIEGVEHIVELALDAGYEVYVKQHPGYIQRKYSKYFFDRCKKLFSQPYINLVPDIPPWQNPALIRQFDLVITINSSVGFESMLLGLPVVFFGDSPASCFLGRCKNDIEHYVTSYKERGADKACCYWLRKHYLVPQWAGISHFALSFLAQYYKDISFEKPIKPHIFTSSPVSMFKWPNQPVFPPPISYEIAVQRTHSLLKDVIKRNWVRHLIANFMRNAYKLLNKAIKRNWLGAPIVTFVKLIHQFYKHFRDSLK